MELQTSQLYVGIKLIKAIPMTRQQYNDFRGWTLPDDECGDDDGFLVEHVDGGQANTDQFDGYVSWSPKAVFEKAYKKSSQMPFGAAIELIKLGFKMTRVGWNGRRSDGSAMYVFIVDGSKFNVNRPPLNKQFPEGTEITYKPHIDMVHADDSVGVWQAVTNDILAEDWKIIE